MGRRTADGQRNSKSRGRHRDPEARVVWTPRVAVSSAGVPVYVTMAAGIVVAGMITTIAPSTTAETLKTDLVPPRQSHNDGSAFSATDSPMSYPVVTARPTNTPPVTSWSEVEGQWQTGPKGSAKKRHQGRSTSTGPLRAKLAKLKSGQGIGPIIAQEAQTSWGAQRPIPAVLVDSESGVQVPSAPVGIGALSPARSVPVVVPVENLEPRQLQATDSIPSQASATSSSTPSAGGDRVVVVVPSTAPSTAPAPSGRSSSPGGTGSDAPARAQREELVVEPQPGPVVGPPQSDADSFGEVNTPLSLPWSDSVDGQSEGSEEASEVVEGAEETGSVLGGP